jgi:hypothetical protein
VWKELLGVLLLNSFTASGTFGWFEERVVSSVG